MNTQEIAAAAARAWYNTDQKYRTMDRLTMHISYAIAEALLAVVRSEAEAAKEPVKANSA